MSSHAQNPQEPTFLTPVKAIRAKCLDCTANQIVEVRNCTIKTCALWPYRMGHRPGTLINGNSRLRVSQSNLAYTVTITNPFIDGGPKRHVAEKT